MSYLINEEPLMMKEYGRNVQKLVKHICTVESKEERTRLSHTLIHLMRQLNPSVKENTDGSQQRIWDHLYIMSDFTLDIDGPYPKPERTVLNKKPEKMLYKEKELRHRHYGRNVELLIDQAIAIEDEEEKQAAVIYIGKLMKSFYSSWNKENITDDVIVQHLLEMSGGKIDLQEQLGKQGTLFEIVPIREKEQASSSRSGGSSGGHSGGKRRTKGRTKRN